MNDLDALAADLRDRLLAEPAAAEADLNERIRVLVDREAAVLDSGAREELAHRIAERAYGLGRLERTGVHFAHERELRDAIERILAPVGRRVDEAEPLCDARLPDATVCTQ